MISSAILLTILILTVLIIKDIESGRGKEEQEDLESGLREILKNEELRAKILKDARYLERRITTKL